MGYWLLPFCSALFHLHNNGHLVGEENTLEGFYQRRAALSKSIKRLSDADVTMWNRQLPSISNCPITSTDKAWNFVKLPSKVVARSTCDWISPEWMPPTCLSSSVRYRNFTLRTSLWREHTRTGKSCSLISTKSIKSSCRTCNFKTPSRWRRRKLRRFTF